MRVARPQGRATHFGRNAVPDLVASIVGKRATTVFVITMAAIAGRAAAWTDCTRPLLAASVKNLVIHSEVTRTRLALPAAIPSKMELVLRNIRFDTHPGTQFHVILERRDDPIKRARVGTLSFYAVAKARTVTNRTFDVTDELRQLAKADLHEVNLVFEATTGRGGANAKTTFDPDTKLTIGEIELRVKAQ